MINNPTPVTVVDTSTASADEAESSATVAITLGTRAPSRRGARLHTTRGQRIFGWVNVAILLLYNPAIYDTADVISTYLYRVGLQSGSFSYAAAIGIFEAVIGLVLVVSANFISRRLIGASLW